MVLQKLLGSSEYYKSSTERVELEEALTDSVKIVVLYISMSTCPPCQEFTPMLVELYEEANADEKEMEVIFFSSDSSHSAYCKYFDSMPWISAGFGNDGLSKIAKQFNISQVPRLIVLKRDGRILHDDAVAVLT